MSNGMSSKLSLQRVKGNRLLMSKAKALIEAAQALSMEVTALKFGEPTAYVYNPLDYAWEIHQS